MYSNKQSVNILTALLVAHGIRHAVVCPGSRNAPIVHNLNECPDITCYPVTDERSAGYFALGIAQATDEPVVVCVTSGTALLNLVPAVAEAFYQHQALVVISADRPEEWIGQLDGQTLEQPGALRPWVKKTVTLPEISSDVAQHLTLNDKQKWYCNRLVNEALIEATSEAHHCVHINVPLSEPLFQFDLETLPEERVIKRYTPAFDYDNLPQQLLDDLLQAQRPLIIFGQMSPRRFHSEGVHSLFSHIMVIHEMLAPLSSPGGDTIYSFSGKAIEAFSGAVEGTLEAFLPDFILYVGDAIVSKQLKAFLRQATDARTWRISLTGDVEDTFQNLRGIIVGDAEAILQSLNDKLTKQPLEHAHACAEYRQEWLCRLKEAKQKAEAFELTYSESAAVRLFEQKLQQVDYPYEVHYANSTPIRLANSYANGHPVWCNRGVNGIDGTLSTAVGFASVTFPESVFCVIGDLSFFYDQNALWNQNVGGNLRILMLNNGRGAIFDHLPGLEQSPVCRTFAAGQHHANAEGICKQNDVHYHAVSDMEHLRQGLDWLMAPASDRPRLLEVAI